MIVVPRVQQASSEMFKNLGNVSPYRIPELNEPVKAVMTAPTALGAAGNETERVLLLSGPLPDPCS